MKKITRLITVVLSSMLVLLGFGGCKSVKKAAKEDNRTTTDAVKITDEPIQVRPDDPTRIRLLYGPPPTRFKE
ncbi:MAG: hypothetical protein K6C30_06995 [Bacteroidaceae bacterium]|nr:hypothetical protein [Bacteroidaceae bacterium]